MNKKNVSRRQLAGAAVALSVTGAAPTITRAQAPGGDALGIGQVHYNTIVDTMALLGGDRPVSREGLLKLVARLESAGLLSKIEADALRELIDLIFEKKLSAEQLLRAVRDMIERVAKAGGAVIKALLSIVERSVVWCLELGKDLPLEEQLRIVANDFAGAVVGAVGGLGLGTLLTGIGGPVLAAIGALGGSVAASLNTVSDARSKFPRKK
jgi:hypothetical protein